mmetsp:Transcript_44021/g.106754  ORF Transcript_44021/g.106754 Transcript_44021/m.106754 type:complete len:82 (-) Transcript_44021:1880-2125(-)
MTDLCVAFNEQIIGNVVERIITTKTIKRNHHFVVDFRFTESIHYLCDNLRETSLEVTKISQLSSVLDTVHIQREGGKRRTF